MNWHNIRERKKETANIRGRFGVGAVRLRVGEGKKGEIGMFVKQVTRWGAPTGEGGTAGREEKLQRRDRWI